MSFASWLFSARRFAILGAGALFAVTSANAQVAVSASNEVPGAAAPLYSSSNDAVPALNESADLEGIPAAPSPAKPEGGGQYDNKSGRSGHGWKDSLALEFGGGFNTPTSNTSSYLNLGYNFTAGGGWHFSHGIALLAEYQFINDGLPSSLVAEAGANSGNAHIWSFTLDPYIDLMPKHATSVYVTGGGGFYRKVTNFSNPQAVQYCTYFYCGVGYQNQVVGSFSSNQGGWNVGGGVSHRFAGMYNDGKMAVFAEARYLDVMTPAVTTSPNGLGVTSVGAGTKLVPFTFGLRF
jgi:hypothetical protein